MLYREKLCIDIMIPLGTKAFMNGKLRNTNEIFVSLGDGWFTKNSSSSAAEVCAHRINRKSVICFQFFLFYKFII